MCIFGGSSPSGGTGTPAPATKKTVSTPSRNREDSQADRWYGKEGGGDRGRSQSNGMDGSLGSNAGYDGSKADKAGDGKGFV